MSTATPEAPAQELSMQDELQQFVTETDATIAEISDNYSGLVVTDFGDTKTIKAVTAAHKEVRAIRLNVEKTRKALKEDALQWGRVVDQQARRLRESLEPIEEHLKGERDKVDAEKARIKEEKEQAAQAVLQSRVDALSVVNGDTSQLLALRVMSDKAFAEVLKAATVTHEAVVKEQAEREAAMVVQAELVKYGQSATIEDILPLDEAARQQLVADAKGVFTQAEADRAKEEAERLKQEAEERAERDRLDEQMRAQQAELDQLKAEKREREEAEATRLADEAEAKRQEDEAARLKAEQEAQAKAEAEAAATRKEREEALRPEREWLETFAETVRTTSIPPQLEQHEESLRVILADAAREVRVFANGLQ